MKCLAPNDESIDGIMRKEDLPLEDSPYKLDEHGPIFILGCPRSGTTFLSNCIAAISGTEEFVGVLVPPRLLHLIGHPMSNDIRPQLLDSVRDIFWLSFNRRVFERSQRLAQFAKRNLSVREYLSEPALEKRLFCYKEPFLCFSANYFAEAFPNAKFIHIIRDGRDNADSLERRYPNALKDEVLSSEALSQNKVAEIGFWRRINDFNYPWWLPVDEEQPFRAMTKYGRYVRLWREMTERACKLSRQLPPNRYFELQYEEFVQAPLEYGRALGQFLGTSNSALFERKLKQAFKSSIRISSRNQNTDKLRKPIPLLEIC